MKNILLEESKLRFSAIEFDKIRLEDYIPAYTIAIEEAKQEVQNIIENSSEPDFANTILSLEYSGDKLNNINNIFFNLLEADSTAQMREMAGEIISKLNDYEMFVSLNHILFERISKVYNKKETLSLNQEELKLLEDTYKTFLRNGAALEPDKKEEYTKMKKELSLLELKFSDNILAATKDFILHIKDEAQLKGLPKYLIDMAKDIAREKGVSHWAFSLDFPSYDGFMCYSECRELREKIYLAYNKRAVGGKYDNTNILISIINLRRRLVSLLGYKTYADYAIENRMAKSTNNVMLFLEELLKPALPKAKEEVERIYNYAKSRGFEDTVLQAWDFRFWSNKYKEEFYSINEEALKPYFELESCVQAVLSLSNRLYGINFREIKELPVYQKDVKVYEVLDYDNKHLALLYMDFYPRDSKRAGAWMTEFRGQYERNGLEQRPFVSIVMNFSKPNGSEPALLTHNELVTLLHEFGHSLHAILSKGRFPSFTGTNVVRDFVELPSQVMENWAFEPEFLNMFAKHYKTGALLDLEEIEKIKRAQNFLAAYQHIRQLQFCYLDMAWHSIKEELTTDVVAFERKVLSPYKIFEFIDNCAISPAFSHIFAGGYSAGYYSYKWAEVLEADTFSLFQEKGIFNKEVASLFRENILSKGSSQRADVLYEKFRGHKPLPLALLIKLGIC